LQPTPVDEFAGRADGGGVADVVDVGVGVGERVGFGVECGLCARISLPPFPCGGKIWMPPHAENIASPHGDLHGHPVVQVGVLE
jgi:hypothetical protein